MDGYYTIVIDAGHGGPDPGAIYGTRMEKDDNLKLALAVQKILQEQGQQVVMTRDTDIFIPLSERSAISNHNNADLFISIHRNSNQDPAASGIENYVHITASETDVLYAQKVIREVVNAGIQNNRGVIRANFAVLRYTLAPAMLLEMGFITNERDNQLFDQNFYAYAAAIARGIMNSLEGPSYLPPPYFFYTVENGDNMWEIAQRTGMAEDEIMSLNDLTSDSVTVRQVLQLQRS